MLGRCIFLPKNYAEKHKSCTFASVFHGIRFKVRRLFVGMTDNFFCTYPNPRHRQPIPNPSLDSLFPALPLREGSPMRTDVISQNRRPTDTGVCGGTVTPGGGCSADFAPVALICLPSFGGGYPKIRVLRTPSPPLPHIRIVHPPHDAMRRWLPFCNGGDGLPSRSAPGGAELGGNAVPRRG
jgi:hypothetical protein